MFFALGPPPPRLLMSDLCDLLETYLEAQQVREIYRAYLFSAEAHDGQIRKSGEPYIFHPIAVAYILAQMRMDIQTLCAALLHDIIEDTNITKEKLASEFGKKVAELVDGVSKLSSIQFETREHAQAASFQKMLIAMNRDIRVIIVKLADRLHNIRTIGAMELASQRRIARETLEIYAPIANRLGMNAVRVELQERSFATLHPLRYRILAQEMQKLYSKRTKIYHSIQSTIEQRLKQCCIKGNIVIKREEKTSMRLPLHNLENIVCFNYMGVSPALMGACGERRIGLTFLRPSGRFLARVGGRQQGNVLLRKKQYRISEDEAASVPIARSFLLGKIANARQVINRALRDHALVVDKEALQDASDSLKRILQALQDCDALETLRGLEGSAAKRYFAIFGQLVLHQQDDFVFRKRNRRPPRDNMNAILSFLYTLLTYEAASALEAVGLDPYVGFLHADRPGRPSLALDLMEEPRPVFADRLALSLVNRR